MHHAQGLLEFGDRHQGGVLVHPRATSQTRERARPYVWMELGAMWGQHKRMVLVLQGLTIVEFQADGSIPDMIKALDHLEINDIKGYFRQLRRRVRIGSGNAQ